MRPAASRQLLLLLLLLLHHMTTCAHLAVVLRRRGTNLAVPADLEGTLAMRYGPNWRTPAYMSKGADTGGWVGCGAV
jgi:hypothetical protein